MKKSGCETAFENGKKLKRFLGNLERNGISFFEYFPREDRMVVYNSDFEKTTSEKGYLRNLKKNAAILPEDHWKIEELFNGRQKGQVEIRFIEDDAVIWKSIDGEYVEEEGEIYVLGSIRNMAEEQKKEKILEEQVKRDPLTGLYNHFFGKELIREYLQNKNPYSSCGIMIVDIDYFKSVNDVFGHLFGDEVLQKIAGLFNVLFDKKDILIRAGGDEFVIFLKDISHNVLVKKTAQLVETVREQKFSKQKYSMTCSVGVCFLPENVSGFTYEQLFENADWALYRAKENGKNRYEFCDNLQRFELASRKITEKMKSRIDERYLRNDVISTAFEVFEKMNSFSAAVQLLMEVIGIRFGLDRITIIQTNIKDRNAGKQYQWRSATAPEVLSTPGSFTKEDFLTLFQSYDEYGTTVLQHDNMSMYSEEACNLLMQGEAKTVLYAAMYCEGKYTGAISYVVCDQKRYWTRQDRSQLGELTKIISAHLAKNQVLNMVHQGVKVSSEYDSLTGLISFVQFKEETEKIIVGGYATAHAMLYSDFDNFKYFNQKYGYQEGDQLLKEYSNYMMSFLENEQETYFSRVVADQFVMFIPCEDVEKMREKIEGFNEEFLKRQTGKFRGINFYIRTGIYQIRPEDISASAAIDAANYARCQVKRGTKSSVVIYDAGMAMRKKQESEVLNGMTAAMEKEEFQVFFQPRFSMEDYSIVGAEALVRWIRPDGTILYPDSFIPVYEKNGRIMELDIYVFEQVVKFQAKNIALGRKAIPISVNASVRHTSNKNIVENYQRILEKYGVDASLFEIELTETGNVSIEEYEHIKKMFDQFRKRKFRTAMDDFGSGYSMMNMLIDIPVDIIKLDRAFVHYCESMDRGVNFLKQLVMMVKEMGYHLVCEGVETEEQIRVLKGIGCEEGQGYWFARPMPMEQFEQMLYGKN